MAGTVLCSVEGCGNRLDARGLCTKHYKRLMRHGSVDAVKRQANGTCAAWIAEHAEHAGEGCLTWPFWLDKNGYAPIRMMCEQAHGAPPTPDHQAAHSCGNGNKGCIHPKHLRWATRLENQGDMIEHGRSQRGAVNWNAKLTDDQVREIRALKGSQSQRKIARCFGVAYTLVGMIHRRERWAWLD